MDQKESVRSFMAHLKYRLRHDGSRTVTMTRELWRDILEFWPQMYFGSDYKASPVDVDHKWLESVRQRWSDSYTFMVDGVMMYARFQEVDHLPSCGTQYRGCDPLCSKRVRELEQEIAAGDQIMKEWARVLDAIPPCPAHGYRCVPHAVEWVESQRDNKG